MNWKGFLKPEWRNIVIFVFLIIVTSSIPNLFVEGADIGINYGFPFNFYGYGGGPELLPGQSIPTYLRYEALIEDVVIWYLLSCLIVWVYDKVKKKRIR